MRRDRAFALISTLFFLILLGVMVIGVLASNRFQTLFQGGSADSQRALMSADSGTVHAIALLRADPEWKAPLSLPMLDEKGAYEVLWGPGLSLNNLNGDTVEDGVPPGLARLVVRGEYRGIRAEVETIVGKDGALVAQDAIFSTGKIEMTGNVQVSGVRSWEDAVSSEEGTITSLLADDAADLITWEADPLDPASTLDVKGSIRTASPNSGAVDLSTAPPDQPSGGIENNFVGHLPTALDIRAEITAHSDAPVLALSPGVTTLGPGEYYLGGSLAHSGDIVLDGATIYINGDVDLVGSLSGTGCVYVDGKTQLYGNASVSGTSEAHVALMSRGDVKLSGFDGTRFLKQLASDADISSPLPGTVSYQEHIEHLSASSGMLGALVPTDGVVTPGPFGQPGPAGGAAVSDFDKLKDSMVNSDSPIPPGVLPYTTTSDHRNSVGKLRDMLADAPPGPSRDFLHKKFVALSDPDDAYSGLFGINSADQFDTRLEAFLDSGETDGILDVVNDKYNSLSADEREIAGNSLKNLLDSLDLDRPGTAYFKGLVYTNGSLVVSNEINVLGALVAVDNGTQTAPPDEPQPGDIVLTADTKVVMVRDMIKHAGIATGSLKILNWVKR